MDAADQQQQDEQWRCVSEDEMKAAAMDRQALAEDVAKRAMNVELKRRRMHREEEEKKRKLYEEEEKEDADESWLDVDQDRFDRQYE